jgi:hypothetical protein
VHAHCAPTELVARIALSVIPLPNRAHEVINPRPHSAAVMRTEFWLALAGASAACAALRLAAGSSVR